MNNDEFKQRYDQVDGFIPETEADNTERHASGATSPDEFQKTWDEIAEKSNKLILDTVLGEDKPTATRDTHVGSSNYSEKVIQPWDVWIDYHLNPFDTTIIPLQLLGLLLGMSPDRFCNIDMFACNSKQHNSSP